MGGSLSFDHNLDDTVTLIVDIGKKMLTSIFLLAIIVMF